MLQNNHTLYSSVRLKSQGSTFALASSEPETKSGGPFLRGQQLFTKFVCSLIFLTCSPVLVSQALTVMSGEAVITRSPSVVQCKSRIAFLCPAGKALLNLTSSTWSQALPMFEAHYCPCCLSKQWSVADCTAMTVKRTWAWRVSAFEEGNLGGVCRLRTCLWSSYNFRIPHMSSKRRGACRETQRPQQYHQGWTLLWKLRRHVLTAAWWAPAVLMFCLVPAGRQTALYFSWQYIICIIEACYKKGGVDSIFWLEITCFIRRWCVIKGWLTSFGFGVDVTMAPFSVFCFLRTSSEPPFVSGEPARLSAMLLVRPRCLWAPGSIFQWPILHHAGRSSDQISNLQAETLGCRFFNLSVRRALILVLSARFPAPKDKEDHCNQKSQRKPSLEVNTVVTLAWRYLTLSVGGIILLLAPCQTVPQSTWNR